MAPSSAQCPQCGAELAFEAGSSMARVCPYCRTLVVRSDRGLEDLGKVADLLPSGTLKIGSTGAVRGARFEVLGRVQLAWEGGAWDEYYLALGDGTWGWLAEAQGRFVFTRSVEAPKDPPPFRTLNVGDRVELGGAGSFLVGEARAARVVAYDGELPARPTAERLYADLLLGDEGCATLDYNDGTRPPELFVGFALQDAELALDAAAAAVDPSGAPQVPLAALTCPSCGGALPPPRSPLIVRVACRFCGALCDPAALTVLARQSAARAELQIPLGSEGVVNNVKYVVVGYVERSSSVDGERFSWQEYLLWPTEKRHQPRWLVLDEGLWLLVRSLGPDAVWHDGAQAFWKSRKFRQRNRGTARVDYVLGEFYWKVEVGEQVEATDFVSGKDVLSREQGPEELQWSYGQPIAWDALRTAFGLPASEAPPTLSNEGDDEDPAFLRRRRTRGAMETVNGVLLSLLVLAAVGYGLWDDYQSGCSNHSGGGYHSSGFGGFGGK